MSMIGEMASAASVEVASEYRTALLELNSSKPQITFLTMLADESKEHGMAIVSCIAEYATSCPAAQKLPLLYLVDSIIKNVRGDYVKQFQQKIHHMFANIFEKVDERTRRKMYELRQTWNDIFRKSTLYSLDMKVQALDPAWPVTAPTPSGVGSGNPASARTKSSTIFVNPSILKSRGTEVGVLSKELELLGLKKQKLALEKEKVLALGKQNIELHAKGLGIGASGAEASEEEGCKAFSRFERKQSSSSTGRPPSSSSSYGSSSAGSHADLLKGKGYRIKKKVSVHLETTPPPTVSSTTPPVDAVIASAPPTVPAALQRPPPALVPPTPQPDRASIPTTIHVDPRRAAAHLLSPHLRKPSAVVSSTPTSTVPSSTPASQSAEAIPAAKSSNNFVSPAFRDPRAQASAAGGGIGSNRDPRGMAVSNSSGAALVTASSTSTSSVIAAAGPPTAVGSRDPRIKADPRLKPPDTSTLSPQQQLLRQPNKSASSRELKNAPSANGGIGSKGRASGAKSRSKERSSTGLDKDQLFKPDIVTKVPPKIKIDLHLDAKKLKTHTPRDPRAKSRDPRVAGKESKGEAPGTSVTDAATSRETPESTLAESSSSPSKRSRSVSTDREKEAGRSSRDKSADRREEIKRELKKVDKKESRSHSRTRKDRSSSPKQRNRSRERNSREPEKKKSDISLLSAQAALTSEDASRMNVSVTTAPMHTVASSQSDATPATTKSLSSSNKLPETTVSDLAVTLAAVMTSSSSTPAKSTSSPSTTPSHDASPPPVSLSSHLSAAAQDSFRSVDRDRSRKRNIRKRTSLSPEPSAGGAAAASDEISQQEEAPPPDGKGSNHGTDSDESDHYEANKPNRTIYTDKKGASIAGSGDVDLRLFNSPPKRLGPGEAAKMSRVDELFGSEDVDLRTLGSSKALPPPPPAAGAGDTPVAGVTGSSLPAAFQPSTGGPPPTVTVGDQDLRSGLPAAASNRTQEPAAAAPPGAGSSVAVRREGSDTPPPTHPQNWDHFREKNPHFKEYQRQCSTPSLPDMQSPHTAADPARVRAKIRRRLLGDEDALSDVSGGSSPGNDAKTRENLQVIASQAEEQLKTGQISLTEYNSTLQKVLGLFEMEKVQRARERARSCSSERQFLPSDPHGHIPLQPPPHLRRGEDAVRGPGGRGVDPLPPPPLPPHMRMPHPRDVRGRGRGPLPPPPRPMFVGGGFAPEHGEFGVPRVRGDGDVEDRFRGGFPDEWTGEPDLPFVPVDRLHAVQRIGVTRTIDIDGQPREIRTYGGTAIVLLDQFEPRTLSFEEGRCNIVFDEGKFMIPMHTADDYKEFKIDGESHRIRLGVPTQELFLDGRGYQCFFGGKPITIHLAGCSRTIRLDGKPPSVVIGKERNVDYLLGKISLVINANTKRMLPLYLDARPQRIVIDAKSFVLKFIDKFRAVEINSVPFPVDFGGLPLAISVKQLRKYLSFSSVPPDIIPGKTSVLGMDSDTLIPIYPENRAHLAPFPLPKTLPPSSAVLPPSVAIHPPPMPPNLPMFPPPPRMPSLSTTTLVPPSTSGPPPASVLPSTSIPPPTPTNLVAPPPFPKLMPAAAVGPLPASFPPVVTPKTEPVPITTGISATKNTSVTVPPAAEDDDDISIVPGSYITKQGANDPPPSCSATPKMPKPSPSPGLPTTSSAPGPSNIDVSTLLQTLIKVGIIGKPITAGGAGTASEGRTANGGPAAGPKGDRPLIKVKKMEELKTTQNVVLDENDQDWIEQDEEGESEYKFYNIAKMDSLFKSQQLRRRSGAMVSALYRGMQCSSCGMRYPPEQTVQYSHHLDWHFRQNKREQESTKKANARKFYIPIDDWMQYEEIEDVEERVPSMFENEGGLPGELGRQSTEGGDDETESSVPVSSDQPRLGVCPVCHDTFAQFFQHDTDEWHYRDAVEREGANYHPSCHQDLLRQKEKEEEKKKAEEKMKLEEEEKAKLKEEEDQKEAKLKEEEKVKASLEEVTKDEEGAATETKENGVVEAKEGPAVAADSEKTDTTSTDQAEAAAAAPAETEPASDAEPAAAEAVPDAAAAAAAADAVAVPELPSGTDTPEAAASPAEPEKKKKKKKKKKKPVVAVLMPAVRIKEEPKDADDISFFIPPGQVASSVMVKQEVQDEPEIQEEAVAADEGIEEMDQTAAEDDLSMMLDTDGELSTSAAQTNLMISTIDGNVEQTAAPDTQPDAATAPRIRISGALGNLIAKTVAKAAKDKAKEGEDKAAADDDVQLAEPSPISVIGGQVAGETVKDKPNALEKGSTDEHEKEGSDKTDAHKEKENGLAEDEGVEGGLTDDDDDIIEWDEFIPPPFTPNLTNHPKFEGVQLQDLGVQRAGIEISGMCSIM